MSAFDCSIADLAAISNESIIGRLATAYADLGHQTQYTRQTHAWGSEIDVLKRMCSEISRRLPQANRWHLALEYTIPRRARRPDAILLADDVVFVIEFKVGSNTFDSSARWQTLNYALDLRDFHAASEGRRFVPVLVATNAPTSPTAPSTTLIEENVAPVQLVSTEDLADRVLALYGSLHEPHKSPVDPQTWLNSAYRPTPNIIEAAQSLFAEHSVADISHTFAENLTETSSAIVQAVLDAQRNNKRVICFITGIPGAGKTLAGLNAAHDPTLLRDGRPSCVFLSGNGPLVKVVREALVRDRKQRGESRQDAAREVSTFISNVHVFLREYCLNRTDEPPHEHAIMFDEAQRAWSAEEVRKKYLVARSEPAMVLDVMERAPSWCAVVALVGGGQEIHRGEAGLKAWGDALNERDAPWEVRVSPECISGGDAVAGHCLFESIPKQHLHIVPDASLHLAVSTRGPRARRVGAWVNGVISGGVSTDAPPAQSTPSREFPVALTRDLVAAKEWLRNHADPSERIGLLASSGALRLRAYGIEVTAGFRRAYSYADWFLRPPEDVRSSNQLEVAATEFECQGLEIDWACVCWGGDYVFDAKQHVWQCRRFHGPKWLKVGKAETQQYIKNKYRVLFTRARKGMVIWVPRGKTATAAKQFDATADRLLDAGVQAIDCATIAVA